MPRRKSYQDSEVNTEDLSAVIRLAEESIRANVGRPQKYENSAEGLEAFLTKCADFFAYCGEVNSNAEDKKLIPDIESLCSYLQITRKTLSEYRKRGEAWEQAIDLIKDSVLTCKKQLVLSGRINPVLFIFDSCNNHGYKSVNQVQLVQTPQREETPAIDTNQLSALIEDTTTAPQLPQLPE